MADEVDIGLELLSGLLGHELSSVEFVRDYVQLRFDGGSCLNAYAIPTVAMDRVTIRPTDMGHKDALVSLIGKPVTDVGFRRDHLLTLDFGPAQVEIALDPASRGDLVESVYFNNEENHFFVA